MGRLTVLALRVVLALALAGSVLIQAVIVPLLAMDLDGSALDSVGVPIVVITVLAILCLQVIGVCVWRLLTMVRHGTVFSLGAFRYVDTVFGAAACGAVLIFGYAVALAPGEEVAPGVVGLICGASLVAGGVALLVLILRMLLAQAVARDTEARTLRAELDAVI